MKAHFFEITDEEKNILAGGLGGVEAQFSSEKLNAKNAHMAKDAECVSVFVNSSVDRETIDALPNLKYIATRSTGFDHIDIEHAKSRGISVSNVPSYGSRTVAEFAFALILALSRKVGAANAAVRSEGSFDISKFRGTDLFGKTLGVIGTGRIGKNAIRIGRGFGMNVIAFDKFEDKDFAKEIGFEYSSLDGLMAAADVITVHTLYNRETYHLINRENIKLCKKGVYIVNTARGEIIDTDALIWGLGQGIIAGAGLDVLEDERMLKEGAGVLFDANDSKKSANAYRTLLEDHMLMDMPNVIVTPHIAFSSREAEAEILKTTLENIGAFAGGEVNNPVS